MASNSAKHNANAVAAACYNSGKPSRFEPFSHSQNYKRNRHSHALSKQRIKKLKSSNTLCRQW